MSNEEVTPSGVTSERPTGSGYRGRGGGSGFVPRGRARGRGGRGGRGTYYGGDVAESPSPSFASSSSLTEWENHTNKVRHMNEDQVRAVLKYHHIETDGILEVLRKRLCIFLWQQENPNQLHWRRQRMSEVYHFLLLVDFEATCESKALQEDFSKYPHEIIEFPIILYNVADDTVVDTFHAFCRPRLNPELTQFCRDLTGIQQGTIDQAEDFTTVLQQAEAWLNSHGVYAQPSCMVSDCNADVARFLRQQCQLANLPVPVWAERWINVRKQFRNYYNIYTQEKMTLQDILHSLGMQFEGQPHSGLDDAKNLLRITRELMADGCELRANECLNLAKPPHYTDALSRRQADHSCFIYPRPFHTTAIAAQTSSPSTVPSSTADEQKEERIW